MKKKIFFHLYTCIYLSDSQETNVGSMYRASIYLDLLPEIPMYCCPVKISYFGCYIKIRLKFETACQDRQAGESAVKCLSQGNNRMAQIGFKPRSSQLQSKRSKPLNLHCRIKFTRF